MITVRTRRRLGMTQQQLGGTKEEAFMISLGQNFLDFIDKYGEDGQCDDSLLYDKMAEAVKAKDYKEIEKLFSKIQVFGTYDRITQLTTKYKNVRSAVGNAFNGTIFDRIVAHTCGMCTAQGNEYLEKLLA